MNTSITFNLLVCTICLFALLTPAPVAAVDKTDRHNIETLLNELERVKARLDELEHLRARVRSLEAQLEAAREGQTTPAPSIASAGKRDHGGDAANGEPAEEVSQDKIEFGGALRFNTFWNDSNTSVRGQRGDGSLDLFRVSADGAIDNFLISAEYRFYPFMDTIHHGWIGYEFDDASQVQVGITQVPFGLLPYAAHNFWFGIPYYLGLSDDYDLGVKYVRPVGNWDLQAGFFKNSELSNSANLGRYSFDVVSAGPTSNEETNQFNARAAYTFDNGLTCTHELGVSGLWSELYNGDTDRRGNRWAAAGHLDSRCGRWNLQLQAARFDHNPENPAGVPDDTIRIGGFESSYDVASRGTLAVANVAYNFPVSGSTIDQVTCYNDYSVLFKDRDEYRKSQLNTTGCLLGAGPLYVYLDIIRAKNMVFFSEGSLAGAGNDEWDTRVNLNIGYYW